MIEYYVKAKEWHNGVQAIAYPSEESCIDDAIASDYVVKHDTKIFKVTVEEVATIKTTVSRKVVKSL